MKSEGLGWLVTLLGLLSLGAGVSSSAMAEDWPQFVGPRGNFNSAETGLAGTFPNGGPTVIWEAKGMGGGFSSPIVAGGKVFVSGRPGNHLKPPLAAGPDILHCLDAATGKLLWEHEFPLHATSAVVNTTAWCTPTADGETVIAAGGDAERRCLSVADGKLLWRFPKDEKEFGKAGADGYFNAGQAATICEGVAVFNSWVAQKQAVVGVDKKTGEMIWKIDGSGQWTPVFVEVGGRKFLALGGSLLDPKTGVKVCDLKPAGSSKDMWVNRSWCDASKGNRLWIFFRRARTVAKEDLEQEKKKWGNPTVEMGLLCLDFEADKDGKPAPKVVWEYASIGEARDKSYAGPLQAGPNMYMIFSRYVTDWACIDAATGKENWREKWKTTPTYAVPIVADDKIFYVSEQGCLAVVANDAKQYRELSAPRIVQSSKWPSPALAGGRMYVRDDLGTLKCLDVRAQPEVRPPAPATAVMADDWPQADGPFGNRSAAGTGLVEEIPTNGPRVAWEVKSEPGFAGPIVAGGRVFLLGQKNFGVVKDKDGNVAMSKDGKIQRNPWADGEGPLVLACLSAKDGKELWKHAFKTTPDPKTQRFAGPYVAPLVDGDKVYALDGTREIVCLNAADGQALWSASSATDFGVPGNQNVAGDRLLVAGGNVYCVGQIQNNGTMVCALDKATGAFKWSKIFTTPVWNVSFTGPRMVKAGNRECLLQVSAIAANVLATDSANLAQIDAESLPPEQPKDPKQAPQPRWDSFNFSTFAASANRFFIYRAKALDAYEVNDQGQAKKLWTCDGASGCPLMVLGDKVIQAPGNNARNLRVINLADGKQVWEGVVNAQVVGSIGAANKLFMLTNDGTLILVKLDAPAYKEASRGKLAGLEGIWSGPALAGGRLYVRDGVGTVTCLDLKAP